MIDAMNSGMVVMAAGGAIVLFLFAWLVSHR